MLGPWEPPPPKKKETETKMQSLSANGAQREATLPRVPGPVDRKHPLMA